MLFGHGRGCIYESINTDILVDVYQFMTIQILFIIELNFFYFFLNAIPGGSSAISIAETGNTQSDRYRGASETVTGESVSISVSQRISQLDSQSVNQSVSVQGSQRISQLDSQSVSTVSQSVSQTVSLHISQPLGQ